jgi:hypothetical protein
MAQPLALADAAAGLWDWLATPQTATEIVAGVIEESGVAAATAAPDIHAFLENMVDESLIQRVK